MAEMKRDPANIGCSHPGACRLSASVPHVKCGTPLRMSGDDYVVAHSDEEPEFYATAHAEGGEVVRAWKSLTIDTYEANFRPGDRLDIRAIDDYGNLSFIRDPHGPYQATGESTVHLDTTQWLLRKGLRLSTARANAEATVMSSDAATDIPRDEQAVRAEERRAGVRQPGDVGLSEAQQRIVERRKARAEQAIEEKGW